jgi:PAS domain S-box-containing protein
MNEEEVSLSIKSRQKEILSERLHRLCSKTDKMFSYLLIFQWILGIVLACSISPRTWVGENSYIHLHLWLAIIGGGLIISLPLLLIYMQPGKPSTRYCIAAAQALYSILLIHLTGGRIETHFHIFGSLAFLAVYRDFRTLIVATIITATDHILRGFYYPQSVFGIASVSGAEWRALEHIAWVVFEDLFLIYSCIQAQKGMTLSASSQAELEITKERVDRLVELRTKNLRQLNIDYLVEIEKRKLSEDALKEKTQTLDLALSQQHALMNNIPDMVWIKDVNLNYLLCNKAFASTVEANLSEIEGKSDYDYWQEDLAERLHSADEEVIACGQIREDEEEIECKNGKRLWVHIVKTPVHDEVTGEVIGTVGIARDISQQRLAAQNLEEAYVALEDAYAALETQLTERKTIEKQLVQAQKMDAIGTLTGGIAHDFNNILWMILGNSEMLMTELESNEFSLEIATDIHGAALRAKGLVQQLLDFSRKSESEKMIFEVSPLIKETLKMLRSSIPTSIALHTNFGPNCRQIYGDPNKFHQVIMNLCTNAYHAIGTTGAISISVQEKNISLEDTKESVFKKAGNFLLIEVMDSGCGMSAETIERIFEPFFTTKEVGVGTGLGLAMVHGIIEEMEGFISVYSELDQGTTFRIYIPTAQTETETHKTPEFTEAEAKEEEVSKHQHVMVVDDEEMIRKMLKRTLEQMGLSVTTFGNGKSALQAFLDNPSIYNLIVTDQTMPEMVGTALAQHVREKSQEIPIILATGNSAVITEEELHLAAPIKILNKPIQISELKNRILEAL